MTIDEICNRFDKRPHEEYVVVIHELLKEGVPADSVVVAVEADIYAQIVGLIEALKREDRSFDPYATGAAMCAEILRQVMNATLEKRRRA